MYVPNHLEDTVSVIDVDTNRVRTVTAGTYPSAVFDVGGELWVANYGDGTVGTL